MKTAILGGSFNPVHLGHLQLADELSALGYERILFIPANRPAHKSVDPADDPGLRCQMTEAAVSPYGYEVSDCEISRGGISYMVDTVAHIKNLYNIDGRIGFVIGEDLLPGFHKWMRYRDLLESIDLYLARRGEMRVSRDDIPYSRLDNPDFPVSSTEIRERVGNGRPYRFLVPPEVYRFIETRGLYRKANMEQAD